MHKLIRELNLPISFLREGKLFIAYSPALDLSTAGENLDEAKKNFTEAAELFFRELIQMGTMETVLLNLGWAKKNKELVPPLVVAQELESLKVPFINS